MKSLDIEISPSLSKIQASANLSVSMEVSFALYSAANRVIRMHRSLLDPMGLTYPQYLVLLTLYDGSPRTVGEIGSALGMDTGTLTPLLKRLSAADMVTRSRDPADERRVIVALTAKGDSCRAEISLIPSKIDAKCRLSKEELTDLRNTLNALGHAGPSSDRTNATLNP
ncbi:MarR family winged helix-turn-helix transcriptional regulator [Rhizorhapis suberifaciens]|uniref:DNA-binding MarR family transcriptional regulator n=1 Tax=Rhizorhapis suberifaciens TaxID=13656 RepID=A0A840HQK8_9SPHN|nr:MarR family winged helix-turn-helix transcriptional regulator [Rhizorhapis suberifaciens]MBB4640153.1 DNA-binding MarR family transcriptional regulator [Rhizorhapis suberifaciens]